MPKKRQTRGEDSSEDIDTSVIVEGGTEAQADSMSKLLSSVLALQKLVEEVRQQGHETNNKINVVRDQLDAKIAEIASTSGSGPSSRLMELSTPNEQKSSILPAPSSLLFNADRTEDSQQPPPIQSQNINVASIVDDSQQPPPIQSQNINVASIVGCSHSYKLYPLPHFDGKLEEWPLFQASFIDTTAEFNYNNKQNLIRLNKALHGNAKHAVTSLLIYPDDVPAVMDELCFNFGRPELLVRSQQEKVAKIATIPENRLDSIPFLSNQVRNMVALFKASNCQHHLTNTTLLDQLISKLPPSKQFEWAKYVVSINSFPTVETFSDWISNLAKVVSVMSTNATTVPQFSQQPPAQQRQTQVYRRVLHSNNIKPESMCSFCQSLHHISECQKFASQPLNDRWTFVKANRTCFGCLKKGHNLANCQHSVKCNIDGCQRKHHRLLHEDSTSSLPKSTHEAAARVFSCRSGIRSGQLFKVVPVILSGPSGSVAVHAMIDEGSSISLLEHHIALSLGLKGHSTSLTLQWYGDETKTEKSCKTSVSIKGTFRNAISYNLSNIFTVAELSLPRQSFHSDSFEHFKALPIPSYENVKPVILLGLDNAFLGVYKDATEAGPYQPIATKTKLGWVVFGPTNSAVDRVSTVLHIRDPQTLNNVNRLVEEYFSIENFGVRSSNVVLESDDNRRARKILETTTKRHDQRFETGLLWRKDEINFPPSFEMAKQRLLKIERKMSSDASYAENYKREVNKYIDKGYAKLLGPVESDVHGPMTWYLPHFGVFNSNKPWKLRIVFDAAATSNNVSLNSSLLKGPEHAQSLINVLYKFRQGTVAVAGDIQEMFSQVHIRESDQNAQRFLWRDGDTDQPIRIYAMTSMIFGAICSPCCAEFIKNKNASDFKNNMPRGAAAIIEKTYVDDFVISFVNKKEAEEVTLMLKPDLSFAVSCLTARNYNPN